MNRRHLIAGLGAVFMTGRANAAAPITVQQKSANVTGKMFDAAYFENIEVLTHQGERVRFYQDLVENKIVVFSMMYATCDGICPANTATIKRVHAILGDRVGRDIFFYSITLRPKDDTPEVLDHYVQKHGIGAGWKFLTGEAADIETLRFKLGFYDLDPAVDGDRSQHTGILRIGNDAYDRWVMAPLAAAPEQILHTIALVDRDRTV